MEPLFFNYRGLQSFTLFTNYIKTIIYMHINHSLNGTIIFKLPWFTSIRLIYKLHKKNNIYKMHINTKLTGFKINVT